MHPLVGDLTGLTDTELNDKINEIQKKLSQAYRMGMGEATAQLQMILDCYHSEHGRRQQKMLEELANKSAEFKHVIDIGR